MRCTMAPPAGQKYCLEAQQNPVVGIGCRIQGKGQESWEGWFLGRQPHRMQGYLALGKASPFFGIGQHCV